MWDYDVYADDVQIGSTETIINSLKEIETRVKQYGQNGWELVDVEHVATSNPHMIAMVHYFKKQKLG